ncbi:MAG: hypothetical protein R2788_20290 [Saprospiraceae bacterium]
MLTFLENTILQQIDGFERNWTVPELLETYNPLAGEPLAVRNEAMKRLLPMAEMVYDELSEAAILRYEFWKQLQPRRIEEHQYKYSVKISQAYQWELTLHAEGLFYKDLTPQFGQTPGKVHEQLFSDFWFYGPLKPLPDLSTRKWLVAHIRNAFLQVGPVSQKHFQLFEYPNLIDTPKWEEGGAVSQDYVIMRPFGIEYGRSNWHDGLVYTGFISFERFLADPVAVEHLISPVIRTELLAYLTPKACPPPKKETTAWEERFTVQPLDPKQLFMESGGNIHNIGRDGNLDSYHATPAEEALWRAELIEKYTERLQLEENETVLRLLAQSLEYNSVKNISDLLYEAGKNASPKQQQSIAQLLIKEYDIEKGATLLITMLGYEDEESYWRNYVFNRMFRMRDSKTVQHFIVECLKGNDQAHFQKAVDVLQMWGILGDKSFTDRDLLGSLNWVDACANDPNFQQALKKAERIIRREF